MREKKFSKSRVLALVLAFAMVVTAVPFAGFDAKAADENNSVVVYRAYNTQTNDHLFTADENEYKTTIQNPIWNDEGRAWSAPKSSSTPIYRAYNTSNGEHLYTADAGEYNSLPGGWNKEGTLLYSDDAMGKPVYRLFCAEWDLHLYTADENEMAVLLASGSWTADFDGAPAYYALADQSAEVSLIDMDGLQEDGTAIETDTLQVVFGSALGVPASVAWYHDGAVVKVVTQDLNEYAFRIGRNSNALGNADDLEVGEYYASITNQEGKTFTTGSIVVGEVVDATIEDFTVSNNMEFLLTNQSVLTAACKDNAKSGQAMEAMTKAIEISKTTTNAVITATLNKDYTDGYLYLIPADDTEITDTTATQYVDLKNDATIDKATVTKQKDFNSAKLWDIIYNEAFTWAAPTGMTGMKYVSKDGKANYMFANKAFKVELKRGESYRLVYSADKLNKGDSVLLLPDSEDAECPYVMAPDEVTVTNRKDETDTPGWSAKVRLSAFDMDAAWITNVTANNANATLKLFENTSVKNTGGTEFAGEQPAGGPAVNLLGGEQVAGRSKANHGTGGINIAVYAEFEAPAGIFGDEALKLVSDAAELAAKPATAITFEESTIDPADAVVTLDGLRSKASGTLYLLQGDTAHKTMDAIADKDLSTAIGSEWIAGGTEEAYIEDVFNNGQLQDAAKSESSFRVVFVPDDEDLYGQMDDTQNGYTLEEKATYFDLSGTTTGLTQTQTSAAGIATQVTVNTKNQFYATMEYPGAGVATATQVKASAQSPNVNNLMLGVTGAKVYVGIVDGSQLRQGDKFYVDLNTTQRLQLTVKKETAAATGAQYDLEIVERV